MYLVVGLGNPGKEYELTRHNIGFRVIDRISSDLKIGISKGQCQALIGQGDAEGHKLILAKPQTFMNLSGDSISELARWFKIDKDHLMVIYDDLDLDPGVIRIRPKGSSGGHKGIDSLINRMGTNEFIRIRIGIGRPDRTSQNEDSAGYVLSRVPREEQEAIDQAIISAAEAVPLMMKEGLEAAMNKYNTQ
jgi:peptidyl-tRNA hydrolase, PTH1 family